MRQAYAMIFCLLPLASFVIFLVFVPTFDITYLHADQEWASTSHAIVFLKADLALDGV